MSVARSIARSVAGPVARSVTLGGGGSSSSPEFATASSGELFAPTLTSMGDWDAAHVDFSAAAVDSFVAPGKIQRGVGDRRLLQGLRNPACFHFDGYLWVAGNYFSTGYAATVLFRSDDGGQTWDFRGETSCRNNKIGGGTYLGGAVPGWFDARDGVVYFHRVCCGSAGGVAPYSWDIWSATNLDTVDGYVGNFTAVRDVSAGTSGSWDEKDKLPGGVLKVGSTYWNAHQGQDGASTGYKLGRSTSTTPDGDYIRVAATADIEAADFSVARYPENGRLMYHPTLGKYMMIGNLIAFLHTDTNFIALSETVDFSASVPDVIHQKGVGYGNNAIGTCSQFANTDEFLVGDYDFPILYDGDATHISPGYHYGRQITPTIMRYSAGVCTLPNSGGLKVATKAVSHSAIAIEFFVRFTATAGNYCGCMFRINGSDNGYAVSVRDNNTVLLQSVSGGTIGSTIATGTGSAPLTLASNRVQVVANGTSIKVYLNNELQIDTTDATYASGTTLKLFSVNAAAKVRNFTASTSNVTTITGLAEKQVVTLRAAGGVCVGEVEANASGVATFEPVANHPQLQASSAYNITVKPGDTITFGGTTTGLPSISAATAEETPCKMKLSVTASGSPTKYLWQFNNGTDGWQNVYRGTYATSYIAASPEMRAATYRCLVWNANGCISTGTLSVSTNNTLPVTGPVLRLFGAEGACFTETTGASATTVCTNLDRVGTWRDTANGYNFIEATGTDYKPEFFDGKLEGAYNAKFHLRDATFNGLNSVSGFTVFAEIKTLLQGNQLAIAQDNAAGNIQQFNNDLYCYAASGISGRFAHVNPMEKLISIVFDGTQTGNANRFKVWLNGVQKTLTFTGTMPATTTSTSGSSIGYSAAATWRGAINNVLIYNRALSDSERAQMEAWLGY